MTTTRGEDLKQQQQQQEEGEVRGRVREGKGGKGDKQPSLLLQLLTYFPKPFIARPLQVECLRRVGEEALKQGYRDIIISAPTGIGKSMIALTLANAYGKYELLRVRGEVEGKEGIEEEEGEGEEEGIEEEEGEEEGADILTATTFLQDQYAREFRDREIRTIMGRGNFLCLKYDLPAREIPTSECRKVVEEEEVEEEEGEREGRRRRRRRGEKVIARDKKKKAKEKKKVKVVYCIYHPKHGGNCPYYKQKIEGLRSRIRVMNYHEYLTLLARGELSSSNSDHSKRPRPIIADNG